MQQRVGNLAMAQNVDRDTGQNSRLQCDWKKLRSQPDRWKTGLEGRELKEEREHHLRF